MPSLADAGTPLTSARARLAGVRTGLAGGWLADARAKLRLDGAVRNDGSQHHAPGDHA